jgi:hypothetical protein
LKFGGLAAQDTARRDGIAAHCRGEGRGEVAHQLHEALREKLKLNSFVDARIDLLEPSVDGTSRATGTST